MKKRIIHKILIPALVVMLMTPFCFTTVKADATNQDILDMLTSIRSQIVYILQTQRIGSTGNYDTIDYLQKMDTNLLELDTHLTEIMADMTAAWDQTDPIQTDNYFESILNYFKAFYDGIGSSSTHLYYIRGNTASMVNALNNISSDLDHISAKIDELVTLVSNIDNTIDTITWQDTGYSYSISNDGVNWQTSSYVSVKNNSNVGYIKIEADVLSSSLLNIGLDFGAVTLGVNDYFTIDIGYLENGTIKYIDNKDLIVYPNTYYRFNNIYNLYLCNMYNFSSAYPTIIRINYSDGSNKRLYMPLYIKRIINDDIEYWQLLSYFNQYESFKKIINNQESIINKLDIIIDGNNTSNSVVNQNNNLNQQLQTSVTQYDQVENQFKESFSTNMNQISKPDLSNIVSAAAWYTTQLTSLFNASGSFQIIYVLPLVLGIALFFIGRGAVAFRQSSNQETRWVETVKDENGFTTRHGTIRSETVRGKGRYK